MRWKGQDAGQQVGGGRRPAEADSGRADRGAGLPAGQAAGPGMVATSSSPPLHLPVRYMMLGLAGFVVFGVVLAAEAFRLGRDDATVPGVVALTHLLTLASLLSFVMGAVYQLTTVAFLIRLASERAACINFWLYAVSIAGLIPAMAAWWLPGLMVFGTLASVAVIVYAAIVGVTLRRTRVGGPMRLFVLAAHVHLVLAVVAAWLIILAAAGTGALARWYLPLLATHILLAAGGFFTFLVMGFTGKLLPMFTLAHGYPQYRPRWLFWLAETALWTLITAAWTSWRVLWWLGGAAALVVFLWFGLSVWSMLRHRMRKRIEPPVQSAVAAACAGGAGALWLLGQVAARGGSAVWQSVTGFYLLGWVAWTLMSYAYKIVPFLVWTHRHSKRTGSGRPVLIADLLPPARSRPALWGFAAGVVMLTASSLCAWPPGVAVGALAVAAAVIGFAWQLLGVLDIRTTAKEWMARD